jgi:toxin ParE1/3/4
VILVLSSEAEADLKGIFRYTRDRFGKDQAHRYVAAINARMALAARSPRSARRIVGIPEEMWRLAAQSHHIYFVRIDGGIRVIRILHERMDPPRHLG